MARGSFLVSREAARIMIDQEMGGDLVYIVSKNAFFAGPNNVAYGASKADQAHQVRLLAAELGAFGIRVNGVNPDGVVRGSGIFAKGWGADRARTYGIPEDKLGEFYAQRTLLKREVLPGARGRGRVRPDRRRAEPDHRAPHPRRRGCRRRLPAVTAGSLAAVDLGASSGRVMIGRVGPRTLELREVHRFPNDPVALPDGLHWDMLGLYREVVDGPPGAWSRGRDSCAAIGVDSWGVDYGLLDEAGSLIGAPFHYRDRRTAAAVPAVHAVVPFERLYARTGTQFQPFNTVYQLTAEGGTPRFAAARTMLLIPDLIGYWLTRRSIAAEETNALDDRALRHRAARLGDRPARRAGPAARDLPVDDPSTGTRSSGPLRPDDRGRRRDSRRRPSWPTSDRTTRPRRSSASRRRDERFAYIACGTWALVGVELERPILTEASRAANFTNELGVDGRIRYLRNVMGLWLLQESLRTWEHAGEPSDLAGLLAAAAELPSGGPQFDVDDPVFLPPGRHAGADREGVPAGRPDAASGGPRIARPLHHRQPGGRVRADRRGCGATVRADSRGGPPGRRRQPQHAAVPARPPTPAGGPSWPARSRRRRSATCWSRRAHTGSCDGDLEALRALVRETAPCGDSSHGLAWPGR